MQRFVQRSIALFAVFAAVVFAPAPVAHAQADAAEKGGAAWHLVVPQLEAGLQSPVVQIQVETLQHIIFIATHHPGKADFSSTVDLLLAHYRQGADVRQRTLALMALHATGDAHGMRQLRTLVAEEPSAEVAALARTILADYKARTTT